MVRITFVLVSLLLSLFASARAGQVPAGHPAPGPAPHPTGAGQDQTVKGFTGIVQGTTLPAYPRVTVGDAIRSYRHFDKKEWAETRGANGVIYVDFVGTSRPGFFDFGSRNTGTAATGVEIKFFIYPSGQCGVAMVSRVDVSDGGTITRFPVPDSRTVLDAIYNGKKLKLQ